MCILEKLNFKILRGSMPPDPPSVLAPLALHPIFAGLTLNYFRRLPMANTRYDITYLNYTKRGLFFSVEKGAPSLLYRNIYFKDC